MIVTVGYLHILQADMNAAQFDNEMSTYFTGQFQAVKQQLETLEWKPCL